MACLGWTTSAGAVAAAWLLVVSAHAERSQEPVHDATIEFSLGSNPDGVWSYRVSQFGGERLLKQADAMFQGVPDLDAWTNGKAAPLEAYVASNRSGNRVHVSKVFFPKGELVLNAEDVGSTSVVFKANAKGLYRVTGFFVGVDKEEAPHMVQISGRKGIYYRTVISDNETRARFHFFLSMKVGDALYFSTGEEGAHRAKRNATGLKLAVKGPAATP